MAPDLSLGMLELRGIQVWLTCPPNYPETVVGEPHITTREERGTAESIMLCRRQASYNIHIKCNRPVSAKCEIWLRSPGRRNHVKALSHKLRRSYYQFERHSSGRRFNMGKVTCSAPSMGSAIVKIYEDGKDEQLRFTFSFIRDSAIDESDDSDESDSQFSRLHRTNRWCRDREVQSPVPRQQRRGRPLRQSRVDQQTLQDSVRIKMSGSPDGIIPGTHPDVGNAVATRGEPQDESAVRASRGADIRVEEPRANDDASEQGNSNNTDRQTRRTAQQPQDLNVLKQALEQGLLKKLELISERINALETAGDQEYLSALKGLLSPLRSLSSKEEQLT